MTTRIVKSGAVTNRDASPRVESNANIAKGQLVGFVGTVEVTTADAAGSTLIMGSIPSNARVSSISISCDALTTGAVDVGIYKNTSDGSAVVDADFFASAVSLGSALAQSNITHEADAADAGAGYGLADVEKPLWQALGLSADPGLVYDVVATVTTIPGAAGTVNLSGNYIV